MVPSGTGPLLGGELKGKGQLTHWSKVLASVVGPNDGPTSHGPHVVRQHRPSPVLPALVGLVLWPSPRRASPGRNWGAFAPRSLPLDWQVPHDLMSRLLGLLHGIGHKAQPCSSKVQVHKRPVDLAVRRLDRTFGLENGLGAVDPPLVVPHGPTARGRYRPSRLRGRTAVPLPRRWRPCSGRRPSPGSGPIPRPWLGVSSPAWRRSSPSTRRSRRA